MAQTIVLGMQWGDEGKGKIVDLICPAFDAVVRFQGGHNAGHTVKFGDRHYALHLLPSGILHPSVRAVLGNGMVISPEAFFTELERIEADVDTTGRIFVSQRAQAILPLHTALDRAREAARREGKIGTTIRGIGPAYEAKMARTGLRLADFSATDLSARLEHLVAHLGPQLEVLGEAVPSLTELAEDCRAWAERLDPYLADTALLINRWVEAGDSVLFEGAQGALLDIDHGTFPYVTSSNTIAGGVCTGAGIAPTRIDGAIGVVKAYTTRVGDGPFTSELFDQVGEHLRQRGNERGTTTGRPRRCGWFDAVAVRHARLLSGIDVCALTKLDVLDELDEIAICVGYRYRGEVLRDFPAELEILEKAEPVYRHMPGWRCSTGNIVEEADLPSAARDYIALLVEEIGAPIGLISTGPRREETLLIDHPEMKRLLGGRLDEVLAQRDRV